MDFKLDLLKVAEHLRHRQIAANKIRRVAWNFGVSLERGFQAHHIVDLPLDLILKVVGHLMTKNCTSLDRSVEDMNIVMIPAFQLWLANMPKVIDLSALMSFCPRSHKYHFYKEALTEISRAVPQVEELLWEAHEPTRYVDCILVDSEIFKALGKLTQLKTLNIREKFKFRLRDLIHLGNQLPNLQCLGFILDDDDDDANLGVKPNFQLGVQLKTSLRKLKVLIYELQNLGKELQFYFFFMMHLRNAHIIDFFEERNIIYRNHFETMMKDTTRLPNHVNSLNLRNLKVIVDYTRLSVYCHLRCHPLLVHHLEIERVGFGEVNEPESQLETQFYEHYLLFDHIMSMKFAHLPPTVVLRFLRKYGQVLKTLCIQNVRSTDATFNPSPHEILTLCPKLEKLVLKGGLYSDQMEPITSFTQLKELELIFSRMNLFPVTATLHAPNLEKLTLGARSDVTLIRNLTELIAERKILQRLKSLRILSKSRHFTRVDLDLVREMSRLIKCAVASLPELAKVKYDLDVYNCGYSLLAKSLRHGRLTNEEIPSITQFFEGVQLMQNIHETIEQFVDDDLIGILEKFD